MTVLERSDLTQPRSLDLLLVQHGGSEKPLAKAAEVDPKIR